MTAAEYRNLNSKNSKTMRITAGFITWVGNIRTPKGKHYQDFVCQWHDDQSGKQCSMKFTLREDMAVIGRLSTDLIVKFDYQLEAHDWNGKFINNANVIRGSMHCVGKKG